VDSSGEREVRAGRQPTETLLPCVWMSAGVLRFRLCDREYECEGCPLYLALRGGGVGAAAAVGSEAADPAPAGGDDAVGRYLSKLGAGCGLRLDSAYSAEGLWLETEPSGELRVGLDDYTLRLLAPIDDVVLPRPGVWLQHGAPCAWINRGRLAIALRCPVAGEVVAVHPHPALAPPRDQEPPGERWWFRLRPHEAVAAAGGLQRNEALLGWFLARVRAVHGHLSAVMAGTAGAAGPLLSDGGIPTPDLELVIGRERFEELVGTLFPRYIEAYGAGAPGRPGG
jgi:glycine cleavage system H lipoate-binding protein